MRIANQTVPVPGRPRRAVALALAAMTGAAGLVVGLPAPASAAPAHSVFTAGTATHYGSTADLVLNGSVVDMARSASGKGYWQLGSDGGVFSYGDAPFYGSTGNIRLAQPVVSMSPNVAGDGYWFVASDGGVFNYGKAGFFGSTGAIKLNQPVVGMAPTRTGQGYFLVAADGGVFTFGDATFSGSLGGKSIGSPIVALTPTPNGDGYWLVERDGQVHTFGAADYYGYAYNGTGSTDIQSTPSGQGYWLLAGDGEVWPFGDALALQPTVVLGPGQRARGLASTLDGRGLWVTTSGRMRTPSTAGAAGPHGFLYTDARGPVSWSTCDVDWYFNPANAPTGAEALLAEGFAHAAAVTGTRFRYRGKTSSAVAPDTDGAIIVGWVPGTASTGVASPQMRQTAGGFRIVSGSIRFNPTQKLDVSWSPTGWGAVLLHEIGHSLGLDHVNDQTQLMHPQGGRLNDFAPGDLAGLHTLRRATGC